MKVITRMKRKKKPFLYLMIPVFVFWLAFSVIVQTLPEAETTPENIKNIEGNPPLQIPSTTDKTKQNYYLLMGGLES